MASQQSRALTDEQLPDVDVGVVPLYEELEHVGVEPEGGQVDHVVSLVVRPQQVGSHVNEHPHHRQRARTGRQQNRG